MLLEHAAAILLFSGPLFYVGLWMAIDPAGFAWLPESALRVFRNPLSDEAIEQAAVSRRVRTALRVVGVTLLLFAIVM
jgi:hypothetical protein